MKLIKKSKQNIAIRRLRQRSVILLLVAVTIFSSFGAYKVFFTKAATGAWISGASGDGVADGRFVAWRGTPVYIAGTWSPYALAPDGEYGDFDGDMDVGVWGRGSPDDTDLSWSGTANGDANGIWDGEFGYVRDWLSRHPTRTIYMRFAYEYNGGFMPYNVSSGDIGNFITSFRNWSAKCHAIARCKTVWANNDGSGGQYNPASAYPGSEYVDVVGVDTYNQWPWVNSDADFNSKINNAMSAGEAGIESWRKFAESVGKPISIPEWANCSTSSACAGGGGDSPNYIQNMYNWMTANAGSGPGKVLYDVYFNVENFGPQFGVFPSAMGAPQTAAKYQSLPWGNGGNVDSGGGTTGGGTTGGGTTGGGTTGGGTTGGSDVSQTNNLLAGKTFTSSVGDSTTETGHPVSYVTDANGGTRWISQPTSPVNLTADLGSSYTLNKVSIKWAGDTIKNFQIQVSANNSAWTTVYSGATNNTSPQYVDYTSFTTTPTGRYLRIVGTDRWNSGYGNSIWEVGAYGTASGGGGGGGGTSDTTAPSVSLTSPASGASVSGTVSVRGTASDNIGVTRVDLLVDGAVKATNSSNSGNFSWSSASVGDGNHSLALKAYDAAGNSKQSTVITVGVHNSTPVPAPTVSAFSASPTSVTVGGSSLLSWQSQNASSCSVAPGGPSGTTATSWQTPSLTSAGSRTYTLTCTNSSGQATKSASVNVTAATQPPAKPTFVASATTVTAGSSVTLAWASSGASSCTLNPGNVTSGASASKVITNMNNQTTYALSCSNAAGTVSADAITVKVVTGSAPVSDPVISLFAAQPSNLASGQSSTLTWMASGVAAGGCSVTPSPLVSTSGIGSWKTPALSSSTSYTLTCVNSAGKSTSKSVGISVDGTAVPAAPTGTAPTVNVADTTASTVTASNGKPVTNASATDTVSGLTTFDPSNITNSTKEQSIVKVEYYNGESLLQAVTDKPFALDTTKLTNGQYTITERTYFTDGSQSEVTKVVQVANGLSVGDKKQGGSGWLWLWLFLLLGIGIVAVIFVRKRLMGGGNDSAYEAVVDTAAYDPYFTGGATPSYGHGTPDWQQGIAGSTTPVEPVYDSPYTATPVSSTSAPGANNLTPNPLQATDVTAGLVAAPATYKDDETVYSGTADWQKGIGEDETASDTSPTTAEPVIRDVKGTEAGLSGGRDIMDAVVANASDTGDGQVPDFEFGDSNESILASAAKIRSKKSRKSRSKDDTAAASAEDANSDDLAADDDGVMVIDHTK